MLVPWLLEARRLGFLGPGPVEPHLELALEMGDGATRPPHRALDLGTGAGVPGLALALGWPDSEWVLLDANQRRTDFVRDVVAAIPALASRGRVRVVRDRAEDAGRRADLRGTFDLVVARGFGPPAVTAECGAPFLGVGGELLVAEPPEPDPSRWPAAGLLKTGLVEDGRGGRTGSWIRLRPVAPCPEVLPRRTGVPRKRPLFGSR